MNPLTIGTFTIAAVVVTETCGNRERVATEGNLFSVPHVDRSRPENSRRDKAEISTGTTSRARWVLQGRFKQSTMLAVETTFSYRKRDIRRHSIPRTDAGRYLTGLKIAICHVGRSVKELALSVPKRM